MRQRGGGSTQVCPDTTFSSHTVLEGIFGGGGALLFRAKNILEECRLDSFPLRYQYQNSSPLLNSFS